MEILSATARLTKNVEIAIEAKRQLLSNATLLSAFEEAAQMLVAKYEQGGRLYIAGNGGSAADSQHLAAEFVSRLARDRNPLPAEALTVDTSILTAIGNDYGYEQVFARQIAGKATKHDVFLAITTSGRSPNILRALEQCVEQGIPSILFSGGDGGKARELATHSIIAPGKTTSTIQEVHIVLAHTLCECVECAIFGEY
jgi:D-sedoheptulose 7-phosphate isomerase